MPSQGLDWWILLFETHSYVDNLLCSHFGAFKFGLKN